MKFALKYIRLTNPQKIMNKYDRYYKNKNRQSRDHITLYRKLKFEQEKSQLTVGGLRLL